MKPTNLTQNISFLEDLNEVKEDSCDSVTGINVFQQKCFPTFTFLSYMAPK
jgi:hypothetical protein